MSGFELATEAVDLNRLREALEHPGSGGFCSFEGWVRNSNEGRQVSGLQYEAYAELAVAEGQRVIDEAIARYGVRAARCVHRTGDLRVGDLAVWIGVSAAHRDEAFKACRYIIDEIKHRLPIWKKEHYLDGDTAWVACAHTERAHEHEAPPVHRHAVTPASPEKGTSAGAQGLPAMEVNSLNPSLRWGGESKPFTPDYSRQTRLREVGEAGQAKLRAARVLVVGAGGLGVPVLSYLAGAGVGTVGIVDGDTLDASNLHRQVMYSAADVGQKKVELARQRLTALNPTVTVRTYDAPLDARTIGSVLEGYDLIVECTDSLPSRYLCSDAAVLAGKPLVLASVYQYEGQLQVVTGQPGDPCLRCLWPEEPAPGLAGSCAEAGVLGPVPGVLGTLQAMEALKLLLGMPGLTAHPLVLINLLDLTTQRIPIHAAAGCARQGGCTAVAQRAMDTWTNHVDIERVFDQLGDAQRAGFTLIDVREPPELVDQPLNVPTKHVAAGDVVARADELGPQPLLLICASGKRSTHVARALRARGMGEVYSLAGGIAALRKAADPVPS